MTELETVTNAESSSTRDEVRARIITAAIDLLTRSGRDAVTTRAVAESAGVQAPTLYRLFGDKNGLLDAVAEYGFSTYLKEKQFRRLGSDPIEDMRRGWDLHIEFGLANPAIYLLMYADPRPGTKSPAAETSYHILRTHIQRVALVGRLRIPEERAANLVHASGCGTVLTLLAMPEDERDMRLSEIARDATIAAITTESSAVETPDHVAAAITLRAALPETASLSQGERGLLREWLDRLAGDKG